MTMPPPVRYGPVELTAGPRKRTLAVTGKNAASADVFAGFEPLELTLRPNE